ncbi:MAG: bifunctional diguanylate cyclase/phosphodiesterase, partial [Elainellaceae cyanobacterium]
AVQGSTRSALVLLDIDRFKQINDRYGHLIGDALLQAVVQRVNSCLRDGDIAYRWGGDEFALILEKVEQDAVVEAVCERVVSRLTGSPFHLSGRTVMVSASLGGILFSPQEKTARSLLHDADVALYDVKRAGRNGYRIYDTDLSDKQIARLGLESDLHQAIKNQELTLYFQPQVHYLTGRIVGLEALVRWQHPHFGLLPPASFIGLAETSDLGLDLGGWVLREAIHQAQTWKIKGAAPVVAINSSPMQFQKAEFAQLVGEILKTTGYNPALLELEVMESTAINQLKTTQDTLNAIAQQGVKITLDDFGTGYSEFARLKQLPLHGLKIDRSLTAELGQDSPDQAITAAIVTLAKALNLSVVAEGVETTAQAEVLIAMGCDVMQGYLFSHPIQSERVAEVCWP